MGKVSLHNDATQGWTCSLETRVYEVELTRRGVGEDQEQVVAQLVPNQPCRGISLSPSERDRSRQCLRPTCST